MATTETMPAARRLYRPRDGRWLGGVCAGLARYFELNPAVYRIGFVALALAGGTGILLYLAAWAVIPEEGADESLAGELVRRHRDRPAVLVAVALGAFAAVLALTEARFWPSPGNLWLAAALAIAALAWWQLGARHPVSAAEGEPRPPRRRGLFGLTLGVLLAAVGVGALLDVAGGVNVDWRVALAALVALSGALVAFGAATGRSVGGATVLGLGLLAALALALSVRVPLFAGVGDRVERPATVQQLRSRYELGIGHYTVDLAGVTLPRGETTVKATLGIGDLVVRVPADATVEVDGRAQAGEVSLLGRTADGTHVRERVVDRTGSGRVLVLDARVGLGKVTVTRG